MTEIPSTNAIFVPTIMIIMKKRILSLLLLIQVVVCVQAQTKSQVISDAIYTMEDFTSDLNFINDEKGTGMDGISSMSHTFASAEYFMYNGKKMESFQKWLEEYCFQGLAGQHVEHSIDILQKTFEKVDEDEKNDKRYRFDALLTRRSDNSVNDEKTVTFIVEWKGNSQYVSILEIKGELFGQNRVEKVKVIQDDKAGNIIQQKHSEINSWTDGLLSNPYFCLVLFIIAVAVLWYFVPWKGYVLILALLIGGGIIIYSCFRMPDHIDEKILAQYDKYETVDSLKVAIVCKDGKWGLINYRGDVLKKPYCDSIGKFYDGMARAHWSYEFFYINEKGKSKGTGFMYKEASEYRNGMALVYTRNKEYHVIDKEGNVIQKLPYTKIYPFQNGYAKVEKNNLVGYIRQTDYKESIPTIYNATSNFSKGHAAVEKEGKWGVVDSLNNIIIPFKYSYILLKDNRFIAIDSKTRKAGMVDLNGNIIVPFEFSRLEFMAHNLIQVRKYHENYFEVGLMDMNGNWVLNMIDNAFIYGFQEDMSRISKNNKYGFVNKEGRIVIPMKYSFAFNFSKGLASVKTGNKWGFINQKGEWVIPAMYQSVKDYEGGLIAAQKDNKYGFINIRNEVVIPFKWSNAQSFGLMREQPGTAQVSIHNLAGIIDEKGNYIIPCEYESLNWNKVLEIYIARKHKKYGVIDKNGNVLHDFTHKDIIVSHGRILTKDIDNVYREII